MNFYALSTGVTSILSCALGIFVYFNNKHALLNRKWLGLSASVSIWCFGYFLTLTQWLDKPTSLSCSRLSHASGVLIPILFFDFVIILLNERDRHKRLLQYGYIISSIMFIFCLTPLVVKDVFPKLNIAYYPEKGILYIVYGALYYFFATYGNIRLYKLMRASSGYRRNQLKYFFIGSVLGFAGGVSLFFLIFNVPVPPFASVLIGLYPIITSYAIVRHQLMDIKVIIKKTLVFTGLLFTTFAILILPTLLIQEYVFRGAGFRGRLVGLTISGIIIIFSMRHIEDFLTNITDKYLFQKKYDYKELLRTFTSDVLTVLELDKLIDLTVDKLSDIIKLTSCSVLLFDSEERQFVMAASNNIMDKSVVVSGNDNIVNFFEPSHGYILRNELSNKKGRLPADVQRTIVRLSAELIIPMRQQDNIIGILVLGKKKSDEDYGRDDLDILLPLARTLAIAISNAQLFDQLSFAQIDAVRKQRLALVGTLAAGMAHEVRNPITTIKIFSEYLHEKVDDQAFRDKYKNLVIKEVDKINHIIQVLVDFSGDESAPKEERVSAADAIDELIALMRSDETLAGQIVFEKNIAADLPCLTADKRELDEILLNLTQNAAQAIDGSGIITFEAYEHDNKVILTIRDTGRGMSDDIMKRIFDPFFTTKSKGFGLGLFIVNQLVSRNHGVISVESEVGKGTVFQLEFIKI